MRKKIVSAILCMLMVFVTSAAFASNTLTCWFPPGWKTKASKAKAITEALGENSGLAIRPRIAKSYPEILAAFAADQQALVYVGSFVQAIIKARDLGTPLVQTINGKQLYSGILVYPEGGNPDAILKNHPEKIAFTRGASSGESSAKAATGGKAKIAVANHGAAAGAVKVGKAKAAVVKNWWWQSNKQKYHGLQSYLIPGVSEQKNPDNVLTASKAVSVDARAKIVAAAKASKEIFGGTSIVPFDTETLDFSLELMHKGKIDPLKYSW